MHQPAGPPQAPFHEIDQWIEYEGRQDLNKNIGLAGIFQAISN